jgi:hypothetical protein
MLPPIVYAVKERRSTDPTAILTPAQKKDKKLLGFVMTDTYIIRTAYQQIAVTDRPCSEADVETRFPIMNAIHPPAFLIPAGFMV